MMWVTLSKTMTDILLDVHRLLIHQVLFMMIVIGMKAQVGNLSNTIYSTILGTHPSIY